MLNDTYRNLYRKYLKEALLVDKPDKEILKADCSNEYHGYPGGLYRLLIGGISPLMEANVTCLEIDKEKVEKCEEFYPKTDFPNLSFLHGDVADIPFEDNFFYAILDFSTLDHMEPDKMVVALDEYKRVLEDGGEIRIAIWTTDSEENIATSMQFFASYNWFVKELSKRFHIDYEEVLIEEPNNDAGPHRVQLVYFKGYK